MEAPACMQMGVATVTGTMLANLLAGLKTRKVQRTRLGSKAVKSESFGISSSPRTR